MLDCESRRCPFESDLRPSVLVRRIGIVSVPWIANPKTPVRFRDPSPKFRFVSWPVAQLVEHRIVTPLVEGSKPAWPAYKFRGME